MDAGQVDINGEAFNPRARSAARNKSGVGQEVGDYSLGDVLKIKAVQL